LLLHLCIARASQFTLDDDCTRRWHLLCLACKTNYALRWLTRTTWTSSTTMRI